MAPVSKKSRISIGSMLDTVVQETEFPNNTHVDSEHDDIPTDSDPTQPPSDHSDDEETESDNDRAIITRGSAKIGFQWGTGKVMILEMDSENQVIGVNAAAFSSQLGIMAKDGKKLSLSYTDWRVVPSAQKDFIWSDVKDNTNLIDDYKKNCLKKLGKLWKDWKNRVKAKYFTPYREDKSYLISHRPDRVEADQWPILVNYWSSNNAKKVSRTNRNSRKNVKLPPRMGRRDMATVKDEFRKEFGKEPSNVDLFVYSRASKSGKPIDKNTEEKIARLKELRGKLPEELVDDIDANNKIFEEVVGVEAPGCLRSGSVSSKSKKEVVFTSREEFERVLEETSNDKVASVRKEFEEQMLKLKDEYSSVLEMFQTRLLTLEGQNANVSGSLNTRRVQAINNGSSLEGVRNTKNSIEDGETLQEHIRKTKKSNKKRGRNEEEATNNI